jgi:hypothetical protein
MLSAIQKISIKRIIGHLNSLMRKDHSIYADENTDHVNSLDICISKSFYCVIRIHTSRFLQGFSMCI